MTNTSYIWGYYHTITNHTIYVCRGTTSAVYFIYKSRTNKTGSISRDTRRVSLLHGQSYIEAQYFAKKIIVILAVQSRLRLYVENGLQPILLCQKSNIR